MRIKISRKYANKKVTS